MKKISINLLSPDLKALASRQWKDYLQHTPGTYFGEQNEDLNIEEAYAVQMEVSRLRCKSGDAVVGFKVGCIGQRVVEQFGMAGPVYGRIFNSEIHNSGKKLKCDNFTNLAIEGEMAVLIGSDGVITDAFPVIELHNFIFRRPSKTLVELIANNAINAGAVISDLRKSKPINQWSNAQTLSVKVNERIVDSGKLWAMAGGANEVVSWLHKNLSRHGVSLEPGNLILTGTSLGLHPVQAGDRVCVLIDNHEVVVCLIE